MIQGDNLVGNLNQVEDQQNMDLFDRGQSSSSSNIFDINPNINPAVDLGNPADAGTLYAIKTSDLLNFDVLDFDHTLFKQENEEEEIEQHQNDVFPDLKEHDQASLNFNVIFNQPENLVKNSWNYSKLLQKIFINLNKTFTFEVEHKHVDYDLFLRVMMVFVDEISSPVKRCQNHMHTENGITLESHIKFSIIRTENERAQYCGHENGRNIKDRLSVLIPLSNVPPNEINMSKQQIALKFVCQNSCIGRKQTAIIFYLENSSHAILSKKVVNIKVCSCPKRDKAVEEEKFSNSKRSVEKAQLPTYHRPAKVPKIKQEFSDSSDETNSTNSNSNSVKMELSPLQLQLAQAHPRPTIINQGINNLPDGSASLYINLPNEQMAYEILKAATDKIAGEISRNHSPSRNAELAIYLEQLKRLERNPR